MKRMPLNLRLVVPVFAGGLVLVALLVPWSVPRADRLVAAVWHWAHFPALFVLSWMANLLIRDRYSLRPLSLASLMLLIVPLIELVQAVSGRDPAWTDLLPGWMGVLAFAGWSTRGDASTRFGAVLLLLISLQPLMMAWRDEREALQKLPLLESFDDPEALRERWVLEDAAPVRYEADDSVGITLRLGHENPYPGLFMLDFPGDWSGYRALVLTLVVPDKQVLPAFVRIDDRQGAAYAERFQREVSLKPGRQNLRIPLGEVVAENGRAMRLDSVRTWGLFFDERAYGRAVELLEARLEP